jgi:hypothetical protein
LLQGGETLKPKQPAPKGKRSRQSSKETLELQRKGGDGGLPLLLPFSARNQGNPSYAEEAEAEAELLFICFSFVLFFCSQLHGPHLNCPIFLLLFSSFHFSKKTKRRKEEEKNQPCFYFLCPCLL